MPSDANRTADLLAFCGEPQIAATMQEQLGVHGLRVDVASTLADMRQTFFARGGHDVLVLTSDVPRNLAERVVQTLLDLDPEISVIAFGRDMQRASLPDVVTLLPEHHPTSRAGIGAILRVVGGFA